MRYAEFWCSFFLGLNASTELVPVMNRQTLLQEQERARRQAILDYWMELKLVVIVLFVIGWILTHELYSNSKIEDCVLSGRTNCVPIDTKSSTY
jgi:hypothetical protein